MWFFRYLKFLLLFYIPSANIPFTSLFSEEALSTNFILPSCTSSLVTSKDRRLLWGKGTGTNPTDRAKSGTKRSILVDSKGVPLGVCVDSANKHDMRMSKATPQSIVIYRPEPTMRSKQHMCLDKGYNFPKATLKYGYTIHISH